MNEEVDRLEANDIIRNAHYLGWLANVAVVKKKNRKTEYASILLI